MFIHLHCHSHYSFLRAVPSPQELVDAAVAASASAVALTDTNGLYGAVPFYQAARAAGVKPIIGTLLDVDVSDCRGTIPQWRDAPTEIIRERSKEIGGGDVPGLEIERGR